jgi:aryl-alcohol dehydrogenase-like predicted oxidoreductase
MERRRLGRTEHASTIAVLGGAAFARATPEQTEAAFADAVERGVNHLDIAPRYGDAEVLVGGVLEAVRDRFFVGCKTTRRNPDGVKAQLEESMQRLHTDRIDLYQLHAVTSLEVLEERVDAAETILRARDEGVVRFAGITGHDLGAPGAFIEALRRWDLDTVMFPVNARMWADAGYRADAERLLELCAERDVGVMAIKAAAKRPWGNSGDNTGDDSRRFATTWYEPFDAGDEVRRGVSFTLSVPGVHAFCTPGDLAVLRLALDAAEAHEAISGDERERAVEEAAGLPSIFPMPVG